MDEEQKSSLKATVLWYINLQDVIGGIIRKSLNNRVLEVAKRYIKAAYVEDSYDSIPSDGRVYYKWDIDKSGTVNVRWEESWNYGGHDAGSFSFPAEYIYDDEQLVAYETRRIVEKEQIRLKKEMCEIERKRKQLQKLKEELGDKND